MHSKSALNEFAAFGNPPAFDQPLHVGQPNLGDRSRLVERLNDILDRRWLTNDGPYVREFEGRIAELSGAAHAIAVSNGTTGLEIAIRAAGLAGEVIVPSFTFAATVHALHWLGIKPVFCDIDPATHCLDPDRLEALITPRTTGILGVHLWGRPCEVDRLQAIADRRGLKLLFDAAHALACSWRGRPIGQFGLAEIFSFHATKFLNSFEGGAIVTNDDALAAKLRLMRNFGFAGYDRVDDAGINGKMHEFSAAAGLTNLESVAAFIAANRRNYESYRDELRDIPGLSLLEYDERERCNYQYIVVEIDEAVCQVRRDLLVEVLWAENVLARRYFYPGCHRVEPYRSLNPDAGARLPATEAVAERVLLLPTGSTIQAADVRAICEILRAAVRQGPELTRRLEAQPLRFVNVV
ncbi:MAG TPA: aminotransferase class I/II-fold pyridoxal phosphate-dependent enzyme [Pirellulales bacterium]|jgi:dTDP-4-amino-4,6-dideoxygalactose transaminase|nr:aminotransferase class I/II-fold pyridoxal phosphate-dependent enzyme [Pirellulales bacterium]